MALPDAVNRQRHDGDEDEDDSDNRAAARYGRMIRRALVIVRTMAARLGRPVWRRLEVRI
jgi:hypothetical protein